VRFAQSADTFTVEEIPLFSLCGHGEHFYLKTRRRGLSTPFILKELHRRLRVGEEELGCAGMKDRDAVALQSFSVPARLRRQAVGVLEELGVEVLAATPHTHKLRTGKLAGNRFTLVVELESDDERAPLRDGCVRLSREGMPNAFGPQRFADFSGVEAGRRLFLGLRPQGPFRRSRFSLSVFQALLFNELLAIRRERGLYPLPVPGDVVKRHDTGGEFVAPDVDDNLVWRVESLEASPAGPIFGRKMAQAQADALAIELEVLTRHGLNLGSVAATRAPGTRRFLRVPTGAIAVDLSSEAGSARLSFSLPPGSYASVLLQELGVRIIPPAT
jgi:tRNA pseudouridine13 synthase